MQKRFGFRAIRPEPVWNKEFDMTNPYEKNESGKREEKAPGQAGTNPQGQKEPGRESNTPREGHGRSSQPGENPKPSSGKSEEDERES